MKLQDVARPQPVAAGTIRRTGGVLRYLARWGGLPMQVAANIVIGIVAAIQEVAG